MSAQWMVFDILAEAGMWWTTVTLAVVGIGLTIWVVVELWNMPEPGPRPESYFEEDGADGEKLG